MREQYYVPVAITSYIYIYIFLLFSYELFMQWCSHTRADQGLAQATQIFSPGKKFDCIYVIIIATVVMA